MTSFVHFFLLRARSLRLEALTCASGAPARNKCELYDLIVDSTSLTDYHDALMLQRKLQRERIDGYAVNDALIVSQHPPTYTLGTGSTKLHVKFDEESPPEGSSLYRTERGGEVTFHAPGQVVIYPILSLKNYRKDLHWYISQLEEAVILGLDDGFGLQGERKQGLRGVWIGDRKIAAVGINVSRWVSMHGIAVNIKMEEHASGFDKITPCGIKEFGVIELAEYFPDVDVRQTAQVFVDSFAQAFALEYVQPENVGDFGDLSMRP
uniref:lipoyl(octanoyl) transferase n=1 Tax=Rhodosorus marinus TaxID=101924 RepID=A0A7S3EKS8_9RHOD|mmetsp:Transcript_43787/g.171284  ORF Transcript_43787/g.171284 Transcript_43787/m.171284 type:complete len:265 (+) Transcript_43787:255-1049(+)